MSEFSRFGQRDREQSTRDVRTTLERAGAKGRLTFEQIRDEVWLGRIERLGLAEEAPPLPTETWISVGIDRLIRAGVVRSAFRKEEELRKIVYSLKSISSPHT